MKRIKSVLNIFLLLTFISFNFNAHIQASVGTTISVISIPLKRVSVETIEKMDRINKAENLFDIQIDDLLTMDEIFDCIESFPDDDDIDFEVIYTEKELKIINTFFIFLARLGVLPEDAEQLERDIEELLSAEDKDNKEYSFASPIYDNRPHIKISKAYDSSFTFNTRPSSGYANKKNTVLCTNIFKKMGKGIKKGAKESGRFIKRNWEPIAIGVTAATAIGVTYYVASSKPSAPSPPASLQNKPIRIEKESNSTTQEVLKDIPNQDLASNHITVNEKPLLTKVLEENVHIFKNEIQKDTNFNYPKTNPTLWNKTKDVIKEHSAYFVHDILDEVSDYAKIIPEIIDETADVYDRIISEDLSFTSLKVESEKTFTQTYEEKVSEGHQKIDQIFATNLSECYPKQARDANLGSLSTDLSVAILPPPTMFALGKKFPKVGRIQLTQATSVRGWKVGKPTNNLTKKGKVPKWSTVRKRHWKNEAHLNPDRFAKSTKNLERAKKGLAPQIQNPKTGEMESIELHHIPAKRDGGLFDFIEVTPEQHAMLDEYRHLGE